jgi:hypothetical protein
MAQQALLEIRLVRESRENKTQIETNRLRNEADLAMKQLSHKIDMERVNEYAKIPGGMSYLTHRLYADAKVTPHPSIWIESKTGLV